MKTIVLTIDESAIAPNLEASLRTMQGIKDVRMFGAIPLTSAQWSRPGPPATEEQIELSAIEAEASVNFFTLDELRAELNAQYPNQ
jgi:hypothetical protein